MTNKPMLSVERELLERVVDNRYREKENISIARHEALWELRALLDKPVVEGEVERMERRCKNAELALKVQTENCEALKAAQHQGEPMPIPRIAGIGRDADHPRALVLYLGKVPDDYDIRAIQNALRKPVEQPAPVAVVITDDQILEAMRQSLTDADGGYVFDTAKDDVIAAGRALLEVAKLNGVKP